MSYPGDCNEVEHYRPDDFDRVTREDMVRAIVGIGMLVAVVLTLKALLGW